MDLLLFLKRLIKKQFKPKAKPKQENHHSVYLPSHILAIILRNLDFATLNSNQEEFSDALSEIPSLSLSLPPSFFLPKRITSWYGKTLNYILKHLIIFVSARYYFPYNTKIIVSLYKRACNSLLRLHRPQIHASEPRRLFQRLKGLEFLELELSATSSSNDPFMVFSNPGTWVRWDVNLGTNKPKSDYILYVLGDIVGKQGIDNEDGSLGHKFLRRHWAVSFHPGSQLQILQALLREKVDALEPFIVIKDSEKRGKMMFGSKFVHRFNCKYMFRGSRMIAYNVPSVLNLSSSNNDSSLWINNNWLFFAIDDGKGLGEDIEEDIASIDDCIRSCLGNVGVEEDDEKKELREIATKILDDDNRIVVFY